MNTTTTTTRVRKAPTERLLTKNISTFTFPVTEDNIRTLIDENGEPWFVAGDVCDVLGLKPQPSNGSYQNHYCRFAADELGQALLPRPTGGNIRMKIVNESGLYKLILKSRKPEAKLFKKWVTKDVLPVIRTNLPSRVQQDEPPL
jgi:anti-repressor protein